MPETDFDVVLVGGGLAGSLAALALLERRPELRICLVEADTRLAGNHTWCFHAADVPEAARSFVEPLEVRRWPGYAVHFPGRSRVLRSPYACVTSEHLDHVVTARFAERPGALMLGVRAEPIDAQHVALSDGRVLRAGLVVVASGPVVYEHADAGYQKFVGLELELERGSDLLQPILFDARLPQYDGFRFMYVLPFAPRRVLVEETFFADAPSLDESRSRESVLRYAAELGLAVRDVLRVERGVLPMPWREREFDAAARPLIAGYRGGLFHPVTGYSFPFAVRFALALADSADLALGSQAAGAGAALAAFAERQAAQRPFLRLLTRLLFTSFAPEQRFRVLEHFYRLPEPIIERFYAAELTPLERARIFWGAPPPGFSFARTLRHHIESGVAP